VSPTCANTAPSVKRARRPDSNVTRLGVTRVGSSSREAACAATAPGNFAAEDRARVPAVARAFVAVAVAAAARANDARGDVTAHASTNARANRRRVVIARVRLASVRARARIQSINRTVMSPPSRARLRTRVTDLIPGLEHPVLQGGMHHVSRAELVAAVSNAGALGTLTALTQPSPEALRREIERVRGMITRKTRDGRPAPFAVNFTLLPALKPPDYESYARVVCECAPAAVETAGANPGKFIDMFKRAGIVVIHKCTTLRHAQAAERLGADAVSIDGFECAGHPGTNDVGGLVLLAKARTTLRVPYLACGGVGTGRQLAAALALGADGVCMGTRFMATREAPILPGIKDALVAADENRTTLVMTTVKNHERVYKNSVAEEVRAIESEKPGDFSAIHHLVRGENYRVSFQETGDPESSVWSAGCVMGLIDDVPTCDELVRRIVDEALDVITDRLSRVVAHDGRL